MTETSSYAELHARITELEHQAAARRRHEVSVAIVEIKRRMADLGLTAEDLGEKATGANHSFGSGVAKYHDLKSDMTWSGHGRAPSWLVTAEAAGHSRAEFEINPFASVDD